MVGTSVKAVQGCWGDRECRLVGGGSAGLDWQELSLGGKGIPGVASAPLAYSRIQLVGTAGRPAG